MSQRAIAELAIVRAFLFALLSFSAASASAQLDSLLRALDRTTADTARLPILTELLRRTVFNDPDSALHFAAQYRASAEASGIAMEIGKGHNYTGMCYTARSEHDRALQHYLLALARFEDGTDPWYTAMAHNNIATVHEKLRRWDKAAEHYGRALGLFTVIPDSGWVANVSNNLGNLHYEQARFDSSLIHYERAESIIGTSGPSVYAATIRMNMANALGELGRWDEALATIRSASATMPMGEDEQTRANILANLGRIHGIAGSPDSVLPNLREGLALARHSGARSVAANTHEFLANRFEDLGLLDSALFHHRSAQRIRDSIFDEERTARIAEMQERFDSAGKDEQIAINEAQLERRAVTIRAIAAGAALLLLAALFAFRAYRIKRKGEAELAQKNAIIEAQLKEKELLLREIHHRVKNNLQTVSSLLSIQGRGITDAKAKEAVNDSRLRVKSMALIHQDLYREGDLTGVRMKEYVEKLVGGLIASYGTAARITADVRVEDIVLDVDTAVPIGLILNELVTNALKHAWPGDRSGRLTVELAHTDAALRVSVSDDGAGAPPTKENDPDGGFGLNMVRTFAAKLNAKHGVDQGDGTRAWLLIRNFKLAR